MDAETLIKPAADWVDQRWMDRIDQAASLLFLHDYITHTQRVKVTQKLEKQLAQALADGKIIRRLIRHD